MSQNRKPRNAWARTAPRRSRALPQSRYDYHSLRNDSCNSLSTITTSTTMTPTTYENASLEENDDKIKQVSFQKLSPPRSPPPPLALDKNNQSLIVVVSSPLLGIIQHTTSFAWHISISTISFPFHLTTILAGGLIHHVGQTVDMAMAIGGGGGSSCKERQIKEQQHERVRVVEKKTVMDGMESDDDSDWIDLTTVPSSALSLTSSTDDNDDMTPGQLEETDVSVETIDDKRSRSIDMIPVQLDETDIISHETIDESRSINDDATNPPIIPLTSTSIPSPPPPTLHSFLRVCDLLPDDGTTTTPPLSSSSYQEIYDKSSIGDGRHLRQMTRQIRRFERDARRLSADPDHLSRNRQQLTDHQRLRKVDWTPEGYTHKWIKQHKTSSPDDDGHINTLSQNVYVWSGRFATPKSSPFYGHDVPLFRGRAIVPFPPAELCDLLLDSSRVLEYSRYSLGRKDVAVMRLSDDDSNDVLKIDGCYRRDVVVTKIVQSETKVPLTNQKVTLTTFVHATRWDREEDGGVEYMIASRSVVLDDPSLNDGGDADAAFNEILWGVNVMIPVKGHPELTELVSVSQVRSRMVPGFLTKRVGLTGLREFYENLRRAAAMGVSG